MRMFVRIILAASFCLAAAVGLVMWVSQMDRPTSARPDVRAHGAEAERPVAKARPVAQDAFDRRRSGEDFIESKSLEDSGVDWAVQFTGAIHDPNSLKELGEAVQARGRLGLAVLGAELDQLHLGPQSPREKIAYAVGLQKSIGLLQMYEGKFEEAAATFEQALGRAKQADVPSQLRAEIMALRGVVALRRGEVDNCVACLGPSSCIFPIAPEATHTQQAGSREAIKLFTEYLDEWPGDFRVRWDLNIASMTLGEYPGKVPPKYRIPLDTFQSKGDVGRFANVAPLVGLIARGTNMAGGSIFDDFNGDGLPDVFTSALDGDLGASLYINRGDGTFEDRSTSAGLTDQVYSLNLTRTDYDNDGDLDVLLLRGAWDIPMRLTLLRNKGDGTFDDVTVASGLGEPISAESAAWGDYDNDGRLDVFVCGEYLPPGKDLATFKPDPRNRCRLYHNQGDGTFVDVAAKAGVADEIYAKGAVWGDLDGDGRLDLYVSNMNGPSRLFHNEGDGTFRDTAPSLGVTAENSFACWLFDYDNDGRLDIFVNGRGVSLAESAAVASGVPVELSHKPRLYHNLGPDGFRDVAGDLGLVKPMTPMGCNFGDVDNDGFLDIYLGTGGMSFSHLVPNLMFRNVEGKRFDDVTLSSGTGHLQKGHGVSFADWDDDGDLDLFVESGGACPGDRSFNLLFQNPGHGRHWLKVKLVGKTTNRAAIGARIMAVVKAPDGSSRTIYRTVGNNSSFGGNSLVELLGLRDSSTVAELEVSWPTGKTTQTFKDVKADQSIEITEGSDAFKTLPRKPLPQPKMPAPGTLIRFGAK
jgi:hypothetical protein